MKQDRFSESERYLFTALLEMEKIIEHSALKLRQKMFILRAYIFTELAKRGIFSIEQITERLTNDSFLKILECEESELENIKLFWNDENVKNIVYND